MNISSTLFIYFKSKYFYPPTESGGIAQSFSFFFFFPELSPVADGGLFFVRLRPNHAHVMKIIKRYGWLFKRREIAARHCVRGIVMTFIPTRPQKRFFINHGIYKLRKHTCTAGEKKIGERKNTRKKKSYRRRRQIIVVVKRAAFRVVCVSFFYTMQVRPTIS